MSFNLFIYGTLMDTSVFRAVTGKRLVLHRPSTAGAEAAHACEAVLSGYKKVSPDRTYQYAVPDPHGRIRGYLVGSMPDECMAGLLKYEGRNYSRRTVSIVDAEPAEATGPRRSKPAIYASGQAMATVPLTAAGPIRAFVFTGNVKQLEHSFGYAFRDPFKQEILLREKIDRVLTEVEQEQFNTDENAAMRAMGELHGETIRDLTRQHFESGGISDYAISHSLKDRPLRDFDRVRENAEARALAPNYLTLVIRQVLFNQIEDKVRQDFRYELDHVGSGADRTPDGRYYDRTISSLVALRTLNAHPALLDLLAADAMCDLTFSRDHLVDFVRWGVNAADAIYESRAVRSEIEYIRAHHGQGYIPLGAELEFSNIGHAVIRDPKGLDVCDARYDGFLYFRDFALDALTWKLGGHVDDHHKKSSCQARRGFFEIALGSLSVQANLSKPITNDPWLLNQFIHEAQRFYPIHPHSVHLSLQLRSQHSPIRDRLPPIYVLKCLFAIAGDPYRNQAGELKIKRLVGDEIVSREPVPQMRFSDISRRHSHYADEFHFNSGREESGRYVQQFKFLRLAREISYEPLVMGLKGIQLSLAPGSFFTADQARNSPKHMELFNAIADWGQNPQPIPQHEMEAFLGLAYDGLMSERRGKPAHSEAYLAWSLGQLRDALRRFNDLATGRKIQGRRDA